MNKALLLLLMLTLGSSLLLSQESSPPPIVANNEISPLHPLLRSHSTNPTDSPGTPASRDPFYGIDTPSAAPIQTTPATSNPTNALPAFRILGKQQDDEGWSVFISNPGKSSQVWVVKQGEVFDQRFRVSKLAPPLLIISSLQGRQSKTFHIGKDEE